MSPRECEASSRFTKRKLLENVVFGAMGVAFSLMAAGGVSDYASTVTDQFPTSVLGAMAGAVTFHVLEMTAIGTQIEAKLRGSRLFTGAVMLVSLALLTAAIPALSGYDSAIGIAVLSGFSLFVPAISALFYLSGRGGTADFERS